MYSQKQFAETQEKQACILFPNLLLLRGELHKQRCVQATLGKTQDAHTRPIQMRSQMLQEDIQQGARAEKACGRAWKSGHCEAICVSSVWTVELQ